MKTAPTNTSSRVRPLSEFVRSVHAVHSVHIVHVVHLFLALCLLLLPEVSLGQDITLRWTTSGPAQEELSKILHLKLEELIRDGYRHAQIAPHDFTLQGDTLGCALRITRGPRAWVRAVEFTGLVHTDTAWLRRLVGMPLDVPLTAAWIDEARQRLQEISCIRIAAPPEMLPASFGAPDDDNVILRWHLTESRPVRFDGVVAAGGPSSGGLSGRASMQMTGLLRRDRSVSVKYQRLQLAATQLNLTFTEAGAFGIPLRWQVAMAENRQIDQRQSLAATWQYGLSRTGQWHADGELLWRKVTAGANSIAPSRTTEISLGVSRLGRQNTSDNTFGTPARIALMATYSHRRQLPNVTPLRPESIDDRMMLRWELYQTISMSSNLSGRFSASGRTWVAGADRLGPGDEWYLGGDDQLRGYSDREIAATSGLWAAVELREQMGTSTAVSVFAEGAPLRRFDTSDGGPNQRAPYGYGIALWLLSPERIGHLEFAWRDHAAWRDGLVRLRITQNW